jgi:hypothetical protein
VILRLFRELFLPCKSNKYYVSLCVCVRVWVGTCTIAYSACNESAHFYEIFVASPAQRSYSISSHKLYDFHKQIIELKICVLVFSAFV